MAVVAAVSAVLFAGSMNAGNGTAGTDELYGKLDVNTLEQQASQGLPYSEPRRQQMSMIDVVPARMQQLYDTPSQTYEPLRRASRMRERGEGEGVRAKERAQDPTS